MPSAKHTPPVVRSAEAVATDPVSANETPDPPAAPAVAHHRVQPVPPAQQLGDGRNHLVVDDCREFSAQRLSVAASLHVTYYYSTLTPLGNKKVTFLWSFATFCNITPALQASYDVEKKLQNSCAPRGQRPRIGCMIDGRAVRVARIRAGFQTQQEFARAVGCARNTISRAELGRGGTAILQRIAAALNVPSATLMDIPDDRAAPDRAQDIRLNHGMCPDEPFRGSPDRAARDQSEAIPPGASADVAATGEEQAVLSALRRLPPALRAKAVGYVLGLAEGGAEEAGAFGAALMGDLAAAQQRQASARKAAKAGETPA